MPRVFLSASDMQTTSADKRSQKIYDEYEKKKDKFKAAKKKKKKKKKGAATPAAPHAPSMKDLTGVLAKDGYYAQNCHDYLHGNAGRHGTYKNFDINFAMKHRGLAKKTLENYRFPHATRVQNFNPGAKLSNGKKAGQKHPYAWEAHHMLPGSAFYYKDKTGHCFEPWQIQIILQSEYNINHGHNMIPLPDLARDVPIHKLIQHPGDHPVYTQLVMDKLHKIANELDKLKSRSTPHPDLKKNVFKMLQKTEDEQWTFLINLGKAVAEEGAAGKKIKKAWVTYGTATDSNKYNWGALY